MSDDQLANGLAILKRRAMCGDAGAAAVSDYIEQLRAEVMRMQHDRDAARMDARALRRAVAAQED